MEALRLKGLRPFRSPGFTVSISSSPSRLFLIEQLSCARVLG